MIDMRGVGNAKQAGDPLRVDPPGCREPRSRIAYRRQGAQTCDVPPMARRNLADQPAVVAAQI